MSAGTKIKLMDGMAWTLLVVCLIGWPTSLLWWATSEPPLVVSLSWVALLYTAINTIFTVDVRREQEHEKP